MILIFFIGFQFYFGILPGWTEIRSDFPNYYISSQLVFEDKDSINLYDNAWFQNRIDNSGINAIGKFSPFPPPTAFILIPLSGMEPIHAKRIWLILNLAIIILLTLFIKSIAKLDFKKSLLLILCTGLATANTLMLGQVYLFLLLSMFWAYQNIKLSNYKTAGVLLGAGIAVKYFPLVFLPSLIKNKNLGAIGILFLTIFLLNVAGVVIFGWKTYNDFFNVVFLQHVNGQLEGQSPWAHSFQSWNALAYNLFRFHATENPEPFYQSELIFYSFKYGIQSVILIYTIYILKHILKRPHFFETAIILSSISLLFLSPAGATYHSLLFLLPFVLYYKLADLAIKHHKIIWIILITCLVLSGILPLVFSRFPELNFNLAISFYRLWFNAIIFISISYWLKRVS